MPALLDSVAGGAHYSGVESVNERRRSLNRGPSHNNAPLSPLSPRRHSSRQSNLPGAAVAAHLATMDDLREVRRRHFHLFFADGALNIYIYIDV
jgi:hypothetical protein